MRRKEEADHKDGNGKLRIIVMITQLAVAVARLVLAIWPDCPFRPHL